MQKRIALVLLVVLAICYAQQDAQVLQPILLDLPAEPIFIRAITILGKDVLIVGLQSGAVLSLMNWQTATSTPPATSSTNHTIEAQGLQFVPASLTIKQGDCVTWTNMLSHNVARVPSADAMARDPSQNEGDFYSGGTRNEEYTNCFNTAGTYYYICEPHVSMGMRGEIIVESTQGETVTPVELLTSEGIDRLLGISFHNDFETNNLFYTLVHVTNGTEKVAILREYRMAVASSISSETNVTDVSFSAVLSREMLKFAIPVDMEFIGNNNMLSWPAAEDDPILFISMPDMIGEASRAQDLDSFFGKILMMRLDGSNTSTCATAIDSFSALGTSCIEFVNTLGIFAFGLRDPSGMVLSTDAFIPMDQMDGTFKTNYFLVDNARTVDQKSELNFGNFADSFDAPDNYGWNLVDGFSCISNVTSDAIVLNRTAKLPLLELASRNSSLENRLIPGFLYHGSNANLTGLYLFSSYLSNELYVVAGFTELERYMFEKQLIAQGICSPDDVTTVAPNFVTQSMQVHEQAQIVAMGTDLDHLIILLALRTSDASTIESETFTYSIYRYTP